MYIWAGKKGGWQNRPQQVKCNQMQLGKGIETNFATKIEKSPAGQRKEKPNLATKTVTQRAAGWEVEKQISWSVG